MIIAMKGRKIDSVGRAERAPLVPPASRVLARLTAVLMVSSPRRHLCLWLALATATGRSP